MSRPLYQHSTSFRTPRQNLGLPAEQAGRGGKRQLLGQQTGPLLQTPCGDHARMRRQQGIPRHYVGHAVGQHLPSELECAEAADDGERLMTVGDDSPRGLLLAVALG